MSAVVAGQRWISQGRPVPEYAAKDLQGPVASPARVCDALLGGKDAYGVDRLIADQLAELAPCVRLAAGENRAFLARAVHVLARAGANQFLDVGCGLPRSPGVHQIARAVRPDARVVSVDHDPIVLAHGRVLLPNDDVTAIIAGDVRDPAAILADPDVRRVLDLSRPVVVLLATVLGLVADDDDPAGIIAALAAGLAPGSHVVVSHPSPGEGVQAPAVRAAERLYSETTAPLTLRDAEQVAAMFTASELVPPGVVEAPRWQPWRDGGTSVRVPLVVAVARVAPVPGQGDPMTITRTGWQEAGTQEGDLLSV